MFFHQAGFSLLVTEQLMLMSQAFFALPYLVVLHVFNEPFVELLWLDAPMGSNKQVLWCLGNEPFQHEVRPKTLYVVS